MPTINGYKRLVGGEVCGLTRSLIPSLFTDKSDPKKIPPTVGVDFDVDVGVGGHGSRSGHQTPSHGATTPEQHQSE